MQTFFSVIPRVDVSPGATGSWQTVDLSAYLPAGATGAIFKVQNTTAANTPFGLRKNGSTDNRTYNIRGSTNPPYWTSAAIGVDANRVCQLYRGNTGIHFFLIGYTTAGVTFFTNATQFDVGSNSTWLDIDVSSVVPAGALGVILEICETGGTTNNGAGARNNGSTQNKTGTFGHGFAIIGCDANRVIEGYKGTAGFRWYVLGYITAGVTFFVNPTGIIISNQNANGSVMDFSGTAPAGTPTAPISRWWPSMTPGTRFRSRRWSRSRNWSACATRRPWPAGAHCGRLSPIDCGLATATV